jgi:hypothetical protein
MGVGRGRLQWQTPRLILGLVAASLLFLVAPGLGQRRWPTGETALAVDLVGLPRSWPLIVADCNGRLSDPRLRSCGSGDLVKHVADWRDCLGRRPGQITETDSGRWRL